MQNTSLKVSIVIPAYNEQHHIAACLEAIAAQQKKPYEVILVNNKSTDDTVEIAKRFSFVTIINEDKKGVVHARDCGFDHASGNIIGRIDADTILPEDWILKLEQIFKDKAVKAVSGPLHYYDIGCSKIVDGVDTYFRSRMAKRMLPNNRVFLVGSNMAIRKPAWDKVRAHVCRKPGIHEDLDLALHLSEIKQKVIYSPNLLANLSARRIDTNILEMTMYGFLSPLTYYKHNAKEHRYMYSLLAIVIINFFLLKLLFRSFDVRSNRISLKQYLRHVSVTRVNPATYL